MDPVFAAFGEAIDKTAIDVPSLTCAHEDPLPQRKTKKAEAEPETMSKAKWKQTLIDVPLSIAAGGIGYGIGRTLAEVIGERVAITGMKPGWLRAMPYVAGGASMLGTLAANQVRTGLRKRREEAEKK